MLALSSEKEHDKVEDFVENNGYTVRTASGSTAGSQKYGVSGIPHSVLIGIDGKVLWSGNPGSLSKGKLEEALKGARKPASGGYLSFRPSLAATGALAAAFKSIDEGKLGKALAASQAIVKNESAAPADAEAARALAAEIEAHADLILAQAEQALEVRNVLVALDVFGAVSKEMKGTPQGDKADQALARIAKDDKLQEELKAAEAFAKVKKGAERLSTSKKKKKFEEFAEKYEGTRAAERALAFVRAN